MTLIVETRKGSTPESSESSQRYILTLSPFYDFQISTIYKRDTNEILLAKAKNPHRRWGQIMSYFAFMRVE
jgi:hypothetical protein